MKPIASKKPVVLDPTACPTCRTPLDALAFCPRDGAIGRDGRFTVAARFVAEELLGAGERSFVYAGRHGETPIAIKLLRDADTSSSSPAARRFLREARNASQLVHDHTISIVEFGYDDNLGVPFIAMELVTGQSLERVVRTAGPMAAARAIPILVQVTRSLGNAHMAGVLHREVGSRSVLVGRGDVVKVGDYGLGRGDDASGSEGDVFGLGSLGVEMLLGRAPASPLAMLDKVSSPIELRKLLAQCLDPSASARPRAPEIEARLLAIAAQPGAMYEPVATMPEPVATPAPIAAKTEPVVARTPIAATRPPIAAKAEPVVARAPIATTRAPIATTPAPVATTPAPIATTPAPVAATPTPIATTPTSIATTPAPIATTPAPVVATAEPVVASAPVAANAEAAAITPEPVTPERASTAPTAAEPTAAEPTSEPATTAPTAAESTAEPAAADSLDALPAELPGDDVYEPAPRKRWPWLAGGGVVVAVAIIAIVMHAMGGNDGAAHATPAPAPIAATPPTTPEPEHAAAPTPEPEHAAAPAPEPEHATAPTPDPTLAPPTPTPTPTPTPAPTPTATPPAKAAAPAKKPKHRDDAVIVDPFSE